ncbi:MAG TPA: ABC-F family ATP-binding cassette domain-containing protein [candidate division WOR-3 bacterium]|uniref:ABC-F family ATP-binding cassette domain-containing protein n=1 Tax=candidate division WOR-3 bacterium TaxID=2052148 RepID=A0A7V0T7B0_UNCW3|nr:ABC-F family ATP-binding cassette domain-containing protein [candidate division WOR-3 bacterium]
MIATLAGVAMEFGTQELYRDVTLQVGDGECIGLVGPNGSGKSTVLKLIAGELTPSAGQVQTRRGLRIGYLPQTGVVVGDRTVLEEALSAFGHLHRVDRLMRECEEEMACPELDKRELDAVLSRYARLQQHYDTDAYDSESRAKKVLVELGFHQDDFGKRVREQSGGFQVRLALARMLLQEPDLLLLDEPTNYLDIRSIEWLQEYLADFPGAFVMIAHDRYLLDGLVGRVWAIENRGVRVFAGNYSQYLADKEFRDEQQHRKFEEQQALIKRTETFIAKFKGRKDTAPRAMSRRRMLDKLERVAPVHEEQAIRFRFPQAEPVFGRAFELSDVGAGFDGRPVFAHANLALRGGEKLGLFGPNGAGKTTLLRILAGRIRPTAGEMWWSAKTQVAYYEQGAEDELNEDLTVLETVTRVAVGFTENELKGVLGTFLFRGDAIDKKVRVLSGGERSRLAIISVLLTPTNLLILDEPTNHLDLRSREVLFDAVERFERTVVFAAHDRFMLDRLADRTALVEGGKVVPYPGNYSYARATLRKRPGAAASPPAPKEPEPSRPARAKSVKRAEDRRAGLESRLEDLRQEYESAREAFDLNRARALALEVKAAEEELARFQAEEPVGGGG